MVERATRQVGVAATSGSKASLHLVKVSTMELGHLFLVVCFGVGLHRCLCKSGSMHAWRLGPAVTVWQNNNCKCQVPWAVLALVAARGSLWQLVARTCMASRRGRDACANRRIAASTHKLWVLATRDGTYALSAPVPPTCAGDLLLKEVEMERSAFHLCSYLRQRDHPKPIL